MGCNFSVLLLDLVLLDIGSWSSTELIVMFLFFVIVCTFCCSSPLEVMAGWFSWSPLEVGIRYRSGAACLGMRGAVDVLFRMDLIVFPFVNIALTASMAANCESQILAGTSLSAAVKNCIVCAILSSAVVWGSVRHLCKYSAVSVIINTLVLLSIA